jgi:hypothetical protein
MLNVTLDKPSECTILFCDWSENTEIHVSTVADHDVLASSIVHV